MKEKLISSYIYYWRESLDSLSLHSLVVQFSKGNFIVVLFNGDFYNITHLPIRLQVLFYFLRNIQFHKKSLATKATKTNLTQAAS
ncbi:hypothetical protein IJ22_42790 [Paenibacillus naphthalenovorans]|uniref:Uncharacterized protein n=1 Tax=Paenibacillus naphthalenovorans TaxID=162209 RepID=A0A0U2VV33_9BACL|nr:hypothetical protein IJ22_42790 [Paenibacillus naphthalenovorans]